MREDIVTRLRRSVERQHGTWDDLTDAADEIERLRREATAFTVKPDEVLVLVVPSSTTLSEAQQLEESFPEALKGRVVVISGTEARRA